MFPSGLLRTSERSLGLSADGCSRHNRFDTELWQPALRGDGEPVERAQVADLTDSVDLEAGPERTRFIARRERLHPGAQRGQWPDITIIRSVLDGRSVDHRQVRSSSAAGAVVASAIVAEARLGYGAICVGVAGRHEGQLYSPMVEELLLHSPLPVVIVRRAEGLETSLPGAFTRAVVPVTGTRSSAAAQEVAFGVSSQLGTEVVLTHVVQRQWPELRMLPKRLARGKLAARVLGETRSESARPVVDALMDAARARGAEAGVEVRTLVQEGSSPASTLVAVAEEQQADLVVLGASLRNVDGRPFLGHTVETVLERCPANVAVVAMPRAVSG